MAEKVAESCVTYNDGVNRLLERPKYTQCPKTAEINQKTLKLASYCYYLSLSLYYNYYYLMWLISVD